MLRIARLALIVAGAMALLAGCSGAGVPVQELRGGPTQALAQDTLTAMALVSDWVKIMYTARGPATYRTEELTVDGVPTHVIWATYASGAEGVHRISLEDNSWTQVLTYPDGQVLRGSAGPLVENGDRSTQSGEWLYPGGQRRTWHKRIDFSALVVTTTTGEAFTSNGQSMPYRWEQAPYRFDKVVLDLPDGSTLALRSAVQQLRNSPRYRDGVTGTLQAKSGGQVSFHMLGQERFDTFAVTDGGGGTGTFTLDDHMAGTGEFRLGEEMAGGLQWSETMEGTLYLLAPEQVPVWPSSAARDFQMSRWISNSDRLGPSPVW